MLTISAETLNIHIFIAFDNGTNSTWRLKLSAGIGMLIKSYVH